jgi:hypothetical protein
VRDPARAVPEAQRKTPTRPNPIDGAVVTHTDDETGVARRTDMLSDCAFIDGLDDLTSERAEAYRTDFDRGGVAEVAPLG